MQYNLCDTIYFMAVEAFGQDGIGTNKHNLKNRASRLYQRVCLEGKQIRNKTFLPKEKKCLIARRQKENTPSRKRKPPKSCASPQSPCFELPAASFLGLLDSQESLGDILNFSQSSQVSIPPTPKSSQNAKKRRVEIAVDRIKEQVAEALSVVERMTNE